MLDHVQIADWSVAHFIVIMNDIMSDNMVAFAHVGMSDVTLRVKFVNVTPLRDCVFMFYTA